MTLTLVYVDLLRPHWKCRLRQRWVGGAREFGDFGEVDGFGIVGLVAVDVGEADF